MKYSSYYFNFSSIITFAFIHFYAELEQLLQKQLGSTKWFLFLAVSLNQTVVFAVSDIHVLYKGQDVLATPQTSSVCFPRGLKTSENIHIYWGIELKSSLTSAVYLLLRHSKPGARAAVTADTTPTDVFLRWWAHRRSSDETRRTLVIVILTL